MLKTYECKENPSLVFWPAGKNYAFYEGRFETEDAELQKLLANIPSVVEIETKEASKEVDDMNKAELEAFLKANGVEAPKGNKTDLLTMAHDILDKREITGDTLPPATPVDTVTDTGEQAGEHTGENAPATGDTIPFAPAE